MTKLLVDYKTRRLAENIIEVSVPILERNEWHWDLRLFSDPHLDSKKSARKYFFDSIAEAEENNSGVIITGDLIDAMGGQSDPRANKSEIDPLFFDGNYHDKIIDFSIEKLKGFRNIIAISEGNHETSVKKRHETYPITRIVDGINLGRGEDSRVIAQGYSGFVWFVFHKDGRLVDRKLYNFHHGSGYSSIAKIRERGAMLPGVDFFSYGHTHDFWMEIFERHIVLANGNQFGQPEVHLGVPGMKKDYGNGSGGWCIEKGHRMKPLGFWDVRFRYDRATKRIKFKPIPGL